MLVSIIVPCYDQAQYLDECLQSVLNQIYQDWECIIVNDGSPDDTEEIALRWLEKDNRFKYYSKPNEGLTKTRNFAISKSKGTYILPLDADNQLLNYFVSEAIAVFEKSEQVGVVHGNAEYFGLKKGLWIIEEFDFQKMLVDNYIDACAIYKKILWEKVGGYDTNLPHKGLEDWEFWLALGKNGVSFYHLKKVTFKYFVDEDSMIKSFTKDMAMDTRYYMIRKYSEEYRFHFYRLYSENKHYRGRLTNKKFVVNMFCKVFFGFSVFKLNSFKIKE